MTLRVAILAFDDCHASGVIGPLDLLHAANAVAARLTPGAAPPFATQVLSPDGAPVRAANGYRLAVDGALGDARAEVVIVPAPPANRADRAARFAGGAGAPGTGQPLARRAAPRRGVAGGGLLRSVPVGTGRAARWP